MKEVLLSIITVTKNPKPEILDTIKRIGNFISDEVEYVLVDGKSDEEIVRQMVSKMHAETKFISEPDTGIYEAMNKAWSMASGKFLLFINEGDELLHLPLAFLRNSEADVVLAAAYISGNKVFQGKNTGLIRYRNHWPHQGTFYKRKIPLRYNPYLKIFGDFDLNQRIYLNNLKTDQIPDDVPISNHSFGGISGEKSGLEEFYRVIRTNFGIGAVLISFFWFKLEGLKKKFHT